ncbi:shikimate dehydrogenase [Paracoccaceae bacterium]|nr:shikimate dehydrogenase [Paracoccaceae bacterium]
MDINGNTKIFGVVGDPVAQVKTPSHINSIFKSRKLDIMCLPFHVPAVNFLEYWAGMRSAKNVVGFGVTIPHKQSAQQLCDSLGPGAERTGVVNAVCRRADGGFHGENFDGPSFVDGLKAQGFDPRGQNIYIMGAGGAATAICFALIDAFVAQISIQNRTHDLAVNLADKLKASTEFNNVMAVRTFDPNANIIINATSLGMQEDDPLPLDPGLLKPHMIVAEVVAKPEITRLLQRAEIKGCFTHSGIHMITNQMEIMADFILSGHFE